MLCKTKDRLLFSPRQSLWRMSCCPRCVAGLCCSCKGTCLFAWWLVATAHVRGCSFPCTLLPDAKRLRQVIKCGASLLILRSFPGLTLSSLDIHSAAAESQRGNLSRQRCQQLSAVFRSLFGCSCAQLLGTGCCSSARGQSRGRW